MIRGCTAHTLRDGTNWIRFQGSDVRNSILVLGAWSRAISPGWSRLVHNHPHALSLCSLSVTVSAYILVSVGSLRSSSFGPSLTGSYINPFVPGSTCAVPAPCFYDAWTVTQRTHASSFMQR